MKKEIKTVVFDEELRLEAYRFEGIVQPFPNHFHEYYVIGFMEGGKRYLSCRNKEYILEKGNVVLFHPGDNHACAQYGEEALDYRAINIQKAVMLDLAEEITGKRELPGFSANVIKDEEAVCYLQPLHKMLMSGSGEFEKEQNLLFLLSLLFQKYGRPFEECIPECREGIEKACLFMEKHFAEPVYLDQLCCYTSLSKSTLLRAFTKSKGVTPYRYLENIRINAAKKLLEKGVMPVDVALQTGFSDQSHFTNYFNQFIGLAPGVYREIFTNKTEAGGERHE